MTEFMRKAIVILVLMLMLINSSLLSVISNAIEDNKPEENIDETKINPLYEINLEKYVNYKVEENSGTLVQMDLKTGIEYLDGQEYKPLNSTGVLLNLPKIENEFPENIEVIGKSTKATNGSDVAKDFQYVYDKNIGEMKIVAVNHEDEDGNIYSEKVDGARDEYTVICYYSANCYNDENVERNLELSGFVQVNVENNIIKNTEITQNYNVTENISGLISADVTTSDIYNGYINSNKQNGTQYKTEYTENMKIDVSYKDISDEVKVETNNKFINTKDKEIETDEIVYTGVKVNKQNILDILGEDGKLQILNKLGEVIGEINKDTEAQEDGTVEINYEKEQTDIIVKTTKPVKLGTIELESRKAIKETMTDIENIRIKVENNIACINNVIETKENVEKNKNDENNVEQKILEKEIYNFSNNNIIEIKNSETRVDLSVDKTEWTNSIQNEVTMTVKLVSNDIKYNLFESPVIEIKLPSEVEKINLNNTRILYSDDLSIKNSEVIDKDNCKVIKIELDGKQCEYNDDNIMVDGPEVIVETNVIVKKEIDSNSANIELSYLNQNGNINDYEKQEQNHKNVGVEIKSITDNSKPNNSDAENSENISAQSVNIESSGNVEKQTNEGLITDVKAQVGTDTLKENDVVYRGEVIKFTVSLKNDTDKVMNNVSAICNIAKGTVYVTRNKKYSDVQIPGEAGNYENELYTKHTDLESVKVEKEILQPNEIYQQDYLVLVEELNEENTILNNFDFYIGNDKIDSKTISVTTKDALLSVGVFPVEQTYFSGNYTYEFYIDVNNLTNSEIENATVKVQLSKELECLSGYIDVKDYDAENRIVTFPISHMDANGKKSFKVRAKAKNFEEDKHIYNFQVSAVSYIDEENKYRSNVEEKEIKTTYFSVVQSCAKEGKNLKKDEEIEFVFDVKNEGEINSYINFIDDLPEGILPVSVEYQMYESNEQNKYELITKTEDISDEIYEDDVKKESVNFKTFILPGKTIQVKIKGVVDNLVKEKTVKNIATVSGDDIFTQVSNAIEVKLMPFNYDENKQEPESPESPESPENPENPEESQQPTEPEEDEKDSEYKINGVVWIDSNKDGKRDNDEKLFENIVVRLFNVENGKIDVDSNNNPRKISTDSNGFYHFDNVKKGKYIVVFEYDSDKYGVTAYQNSKISDEVNSDAIEKEINLDGKVLKAGATDTINLNKDYLNIDMGLVEKGELDFRLDKYVSKITVNYNGTDKTYNYNDTKLAKVEIPAKQLADSTVEIEYKIVVKNEGNVSGYVKKVMEYIPEGLTVSQASSKEWTKDDKNNLVNTSLSNKLIEPGESEEITIVLTSKNLTKRLVNAAEIGQNYSIDGLKDIDSTEYNNDKNEDDYSEAEVIISVKTGIFKGIMFAIGALLILICIAFIIKALKNKNIRKSMFTVLLFVNMIIIMSTYVFAVTITYGDIEMHVNRSEGSWECLNSGGTYTCVSPGDHQCSQKHAYTVSETTNCETKGELLNKLGDYEGLTDDLPDLDLEFQNPSASNIKIEASLTGDADMKLIDNETVRVGPFVATWSPAKSVITYDIETTGSGSASVDGSIENGKPFYVICNVGIDSVSVKIHLKYTKKITKKYVKLVTYSPDYSKQGTPGYCDYTGTIQTMVQFFQKIETSTITRKKNLSLGFSIPKGSLKINKKDYDTGKDLTGAKIEVKGVSGYAKGYNKTVTTPFELKNLLIGDYVLTEVGTPSGYRLDLQLKSELKKETSITDGHTSEVKFRNRKYGDLEVQKVDNDTSANHLEGLKFGGVQFRIKSSIGYVGVQVDNTWDRFVPTGQSGAQIFTTDADGKFKVTNLPIAYSYEVEEVSLPDQVAQYYDVQSENLSVQLKNNSSGVVTKANYRNQQLRVDVEGNVWEDIAKGKETGRDDIYGSEDKPVDGLTVILKKGGSPIASTRTSGSGYYFFAAKTSSYTIDIASLSEYSIEFEYNGLRYENVDIAKGCSKAAEIGYNRQRVNNNYHTVMGVAKKDNGNRGITSANANLIYTSVGYNSQLVQNTGYTPESVSGSTDVDKAKISADTSTAGVTFNWSPGVKVIRNIDFGMYERAQTDIALQNDISQVIITLNKNGNDYTHAYNYLQRKNYVQKTVDGKIITDEDKDKGYNEDMDGFLPEVKVNGSNKYNMSYVREIYPSYVNYNKITKNVKIEVVYRITMANQSSVNVNIDEIVDYYDGNNLTPLFNTIGNNPSGEYSMARVNVNQSIAPKESKEVYLSFEVKNDSINKLLTGDLTIKNVAEISKYSTDDGRIDMDSAPENCNPENVNTYEDDTCGAPPLTLKIGQDDNGLKEKRIRGTVFNDNTESKELRTGMTREGNGKFEEDVEGTVSKVTVELIDTETNADAKLYPNPDNAVDGKIDTESNGYYDFNGLIPGKYILKYTYSDGSVIYTKAGEQEPVRIQDYKSTIIKSDYLKNVIKNNNDKLWYLNNDVVTNKFSVAVDDYQQRKNINDYYSTVSYGLQSDYYASLNRQMIANTADMEVFIEDSECPQGGTEYGKTFVYDYKNVDFGIVERPKESINVTKEISYIRLILANGQVLIEGDPRTESMKYLIYPNGGMLKIEIDNEIIEGAKLEVTYEIKVENNSELDYDNENYYKYGENKSNPVTMTVNKLVDYLDEKLDAPSYSINYKEHDWYRISADDLKTLDLKQDKINISDDVYTAIKDRKEIYVANETEELKNIEPGKSKSIKFNAEKLLTSSNDLTDLTFDNYTEIIQHSNSVGRFYETSGVKATPGNFNINQREQSEIDDNGLDYRRSEITIVPPTGKQAYTIITIIGLASLIIIAGGIIIIKKKIL